MDLDLSGQYKEIAHTNDVALKQIESAHETYKLEVIQTLIRVDKLNMPISSLSYFLVTENFAFPFAFRLRE